MEFLNKLGLPAKYTILGFVGGLIALVVLQLIGYESSSPIATVVGCTIGGLIGGITRKKMGKTG